MATKQEDNSKKSQEIKPSIEDLNKLKEKSDATAEAMRTRCKTCFKETSPIPRCFGHGGGAPGGGGGGGGGAGEKASEGHATSTITGQPSDTASKSDVMATGKESSSPLKFNPEVISELIKNKLLVVDSNRDIGILTIKLQCEPKLLSEEQRNELENFINAIKDELKEFKKENNISAKCYEIVKDKDDKKVSLRIMLPTQELYDAFIQRLAENLLPTQKLGEQAENEMDNPTQLSTKLTHSPEKNKVEEVEERAGHKTVEQKASPDETKSSLLRLPSPSDGPKPKSIPKGS